MGCKTVDKRFKKKNNSKILFFHGSFRGAGAKKKA